MLGLALEGGGAKGAFHMGAVKAFFEEGYRFDGIAGTSIGAINGAIIAQGDFEAGYKLWQTMDNSLLFDIEQMQMEKILNRDFDKEAFIYLTSKIKQIIENKGIDTSKMRKILDDIVDEDKLRRSKIDLGIVTVSVTDLEPLELYKEDIPDGKIVDYLMASANVPIFKIKPLEGKFFLDGAFYDNCPINLLIRKGYKEIIAIRTLGIGKVRKLEDESVKVSNLYPSQNLGMILNFDNSIIQTNLKMGYYDAMRAVKRLTGRKYYIQKTDDELFLKSLLSVPGNSVGTIAEVMALPEKEPKRLMFEHIIPELAKLLDLPVSATYQDIVIGLLEFAAKERGIERFRILKPDQFLKEIKNSPYEDMEVNPVLLNLTRRTKGFFTREIILKIAAEELVRVLDPKQFV